MKQESGEGDAPEVRRSIATRGWDVTEESDRGVGARKAPLRPAFVAERLSVLVFQ